MTDLARATGLHKSIVARLLATMALDGFVVQNPVTKTYAIGPQAFAVGNSYEPSSLLSQVARPTMEELTAKCGHASYLGVAAGNHSVFVVAVESVRSIRVSIPVGEQRAFHSGAIGKLLLAAMADDQIREIVGADPLPKMTPFTIDSVDVLMRQITSVRETGVAFNDQESIVGAGSVAAPVTDATGQTIAGLAIVYPTHMVSGDESRDLVRMVSASAAEISARLGASIQVPDRQEDTELAIADA